MLINIALKLFNCGDNFDSGISGEPISNCSTLRAHLKSYPSCVVPKGIPCCTDETEATAIGTKPLIAARNNRIVEGAVSVKSNPGICFNRWEWAIGRQLR